AALRREVQMKIDTHMSIRQAVGQGNKVALKVTDSRHFSDAPAVQQDDDVAKSFAGMLNEAIGKTNNLQVEAEDMTKKMIYAPESVSVHSVMIAQQKAEMALTFTKAVRDEAIRSYRELMNLR
ncbi:MAG: flagellar hook-basal body complex protein FliE, partial [Spirochaetota bacterium]